MRIAIGLFFGMLAAGLAFTEVACDWGGGGGDGDSDSDSDGDGDMSPEEYCFEGCDKAYEECAEYLMEEYDYDEDMIEDAYEDCQDSCDNYDDYEAYNECVLSAYDEAGLDDCIYDTDLNTDCADCQLALDCDDYFENALEMCEDECDSGYDEDACAEQIAELDTAEMDDLVSDLEDCGDEYL